MLLPNKIIRYDESVISKFPLILQKLEYSKALRPEALFEACKNDFSGINIYLQTLDCLYAMNKIELKEGEIILC